MQVAGIQCKILLKKGGYSVWAPKKWDLFWCGLPKMGVIWCAKMQFQAKICKFYVKITANFVNFLNTGEAICNLCKIWYENGKKGGHWVWTEEKRGVIGCKIGVKKGVY